MRNLLMAMLVVGLLAAPSLGVVNVKVTADNTNLLPGQSTTIRILAQGTAAGVYSLGGYISATGADVLTTTSGSMVFSSLFTPTGLFTPKQSIGTTQATKGGWGDASGTTLGFGSQQTTWDTPDATLGKDAYVEFAHYTVTADNATGDVTLAFLSKTIGGYKPLEVDKSGVLGTLTPVTIHVPEPMTMALLALGGLVVARRRR